MRGAETSAVAKSLLPFYPVLLAVIWSSVIIYSEWIHTKENTDLSF